MSQFKFGTTATSGSGPSQNTSAGGIFGNVGGSQPTTSSSAAPFSAGATGNSLFGGAAGGGGGGGFGFTAKPPGQNADEKQPSSNLFGSTTPSKPPGQGTTGQSNTKPLFGGGATSGAGTTTMPFGSTTPAPPSGLFGNASTTPAGPPPQSSSGQGLLFGKTPQAGGAPSSLFPNQSKPNSDSSTTPTTSAPASGLLGNAGQQQTQPFGGFLSGKKDDNAAKPGAGQLFGDKQPSSQGSSATATTAAGTKPGAFNLMGTQPTAQTSNSLFSPPGSGSQPSQPFSLPSATPTQPPPSSTSTTPGGAPKPAFGSLTTPSSSAAPATSTPASSNSPFSLGTPKATAATDSANTAAPSGQLGGMFSNMGKPAASSATSGAPATATTTAPALTSTTTATTPAGAATTATTPGATAGTAAVNTGTNLGASTVGPAPPAQSRLKNKTMDEIITRWATDLTKYQKEFQEQAEQVAEWDRMLVENGSKVQKLYGNTVDAERATQEVERQLTSVEGQQDELSSWLDRYEQEVETLLSKQVGVGDALQGPDQEREKT